jgi:hypothetical protein
MSVPYLAYRVPCHGHAIDGRPAWALQSWTFRHVAKADAQNRPQASLVLHLSSMIREQHSRCIQRNQPSDELHTDRRNQSPSGLAAEQERTRGIRVAHHAWSTQGRTKDEIPYSFVRIGRAMDGTRPASLHEDYPLQPL